jgi:hypothetical protein
VSDESSLTRGLSSKEIKSLIAVSIMLIKSPKLNNMVDKNYFRKQLYIGRQNLPEVVCQECANLVNLMRTVVIPLKNKEDPHSIVNSIQVRKIRNILSNYASSKAIKYAPRKIVKMNFESDDQNLQALNVTPRSLYSIMSKSYTLYKKDSTGALVNITAGANVKDDYDKKELLHNFFKTSYIDFRYKS